MHSPNEGQSIDRATEPREPVTLPFEFRGSAPEYFRIWIVNLALTVLTAGVFSAWAKVRRERYFYGNTWVAGAPFEYLADPIRILKGRAVAVSLLFVYIFLSRLLPFGDLMLLLLLAVAMPWIVVSGLRFRARYSAWNGVNLAFSGTFARGFVYYLLVFLLVPLSLGLAYPYVNYLQRKFVVGQHRFGTNRFVFGAAAGDFYRIYLRAAGLLFLLGLAVGAVPLDTRVNVALLYAAGFAVSIYIATRVTNTIYNSSRLAGMRFVSTLRTGELLGIYATNTVAILLSLGLAVPWAQIRLARYRASRLAAEHTDAVPVFNAAPRGDRDAFGAETADVFDVDLSI